MFLFQTAAKTATGAGTQQGKALSSQEFGKKLDQLYVRTEVDYRDLMRSLGKITFADRLLQRSWGELLAGGPMFMGVMPGEKEIEVYKCAGNCKTAFTDFQAKYNELRAASRGNDVGRLQSALEGISQSYFNLALSKAKLAETLDAFHLQGAEYVMPVLQKTLDVAMVVSIVSGVGAVASLGREELSLALKEFAARMVSKKGATKALASAVGGAAVFTALDLGSDYYSFNLLTKAMRSLDTDQLGSLRMLSAVAEKAKSGAPGDEKLGRISLNINVAKAELSAHLAKDPSYKMDPVRIAGYFGETFAQLLVLETGFGFFKAAKVAGKSRLLEQKISKVEAKPEPKPEEVRVDAWPAVKAILSKGQSSAIAKIEAGMEAQISALQETAKTDAVAKKQLDALILLKSLFATEREAYAAWSLDLKKRGKFDQGEADAYFGRMMDWEKQQSGKRNVSRMAAGDAPANERLETEMKLLQPGVNKDALIKVVQEGVYCERLNDVNSKDFKEAYAMLRRYFPSDELDPATDLVEMQSQNDRNFAKLCSKDFSKVAPDLSAPLYQRYYLVVAKDKEGKIIGVCDGNFIGTKNASAMYWAHVAVPEVERRRGIATLLYSSTLDLGNEMAHTAEQSFGKIGIGASYKTPISGNKLQYFILETEPVNQESPDAVSLTWGRLLFHGSLGVSVVPKMRYAQIDLESERGVKFSQSESGAVPLLLGFRKLGGEAEGSVSVGDLRNLSGIMRDGFLSAGLYNPRAAWLDYRHSVQDFRGMPQKTRVPLVPLPSLPGTAGVEDLAGRVIPAVGTMEERYSLYQNYPWYTAEDGYNSTINAAKEKGSIMSIEAAKQYMWNKALKKESMVPPSN